MISIQHFKFNELESTQKYAVSILGKEEDFDVICISADKLLKEKLKDSEWISEDSINNAENNRKQSDFSSTKEPNLAGNDINCSYVVILSREMDSLEVTQRAMVAITETLEEYGIYCKIRWLNDIMLNNEALGGVFCDIVIVHGVRYLIAGVNLKKKAIEGGVDVPSMGSPEGYIEVKDSIDRDKLIIDCGRAVCEFFSVDYHEIIHNYSNRMEYIGMQLYSAGEPLGELVGLGDDGSMHLISSEGKHLFLRNQRIEYFVKDLN